MQYRRGYLTELKALENLKKDGWIVSRSAQSRGMFDLIALNELEVKCIQVKRIKKLNGSESLHKTFKEILGIEKLKVPVSVSKELWVWVDFKGWIKIKLKDDTFKKVGEFRKFIRNYNEYSK